MRAEAVAAFACVAFTALPACVPGVRAQQPPTVDGATREVVAEDLRESIVHVDVTLRDRYGREETRPMAITIYRPEGAGPSPLVVFNHGRAVPEKRAAQGRSRPENLARYLAAKGFVVLAPTRVGYWETYGDFDPEDSGSCNDLRPEAMAKATSDEVLATVDYAKSLPYVDTTRWIVAGQSVGGLAAIATVARRPTGLVAGINFSGGTGGNPDKSPGRPCSPARLQTLWTRQSAGAAAPMLWMYWPNDLFFGEDVPKRWFQAWTDGGAKADFVTFPPSGSDGHNGLNADMDHWLPVVDRFLAGLGFDRPGIVATPPASTLAAIDDRRQPSLAGTRRQAAYERFLEASAPRAFAVGDRGGYGYASGDYARGRALGYCRRTGQTCALYAVDGDVVWGNR